MDFIDEIRTRSGRFSQAIGTFEGQGSDKYLASTMDLHNIRNFLDLLHGASLLTFKIQTKSE